MPRPHPVPLPFQASVPVVGMVHLLALPGAPGGDGEMGPVVERARRDARALVDGGVDGILVENFGDAPFFGGDVPPETVAAVTRAVLEVQDEVSGSVPVGVNVLRNDVRAALGIAAATGASFVRVNVHTGTMSTDQGRLTGRAAETLRTRRALCPGVALVADVHVKHATPPPGETLVNAALDCWHRGLAEAVIVSGSGTGSATDPERVRQVRRALGSAPVWVGSGATPDSVSMLIEAGATGFIVGSALQERGVPGAPVDPERVRRFTTAVAGGDTHG